VKWRADRQWYGPPGPERLRTLTGTLHGTSRARNHDLLRPVDICRADDFSGGSFLARPGHECQVASENRRHRPGSHRHGLLHVPPPPANKRHGIAKVDCAGSDVG
jgi:hypothetical protein